MYAEESLVGMGPFVAPAANGSGRVFDLADAPGPFELLVGQTAVAAPASRRHYANWSDADDLAKRRQPRDQTIAGQPLTLSSVLVYPSSGGGRSERVSLLQNFKIDGAALRADHRAYLSDTAGWMMRNGGKWRVFAEAHASHTGARRHDDVLSEDRYLTVRAFLEAELARLGSDAGRVRIAGQGVGFRHTLLPGEDPASRSVYLVVQADPAASPPPAWPPHGAPANWPPAPTPVPVAPPVGELNLDDFIEALQAAESANAADSPEQFLTRLRQLYYPGTDPVGLTLREAAFDQLLPDAPFRSADGTRRILTRRGMDSRMFDRLAQHAPENPTPGNPLDNPSPYLVDASGSRVDIGHVVLTMDALAHPRAAIPYTTFGVPAIDPASWVADLGSAAVWAESDGQPGAPRVLPRLADGQPDLDGYYRMSAPDADLLGDIDGFNIWNAWTGSGGSLSAVFIAYYFDTSMVAAGRGGYRRRFRAFCTNTIGRLPQDAGQLAATNAIWRPRIDRFNDLFAAGAFSALFRLTPPPRRQWRFTPEVFARFLRWLEDGTRAESRRFP